MPMAAWRIVGSESRKPYIAARARTRSDDTRAPMRTSLPPNFDLSGYTARVSTRRRAPVSRGSPRIGVGRGPSRLRAAWTRGWAKGFRPSRS